MARLRGGRTRRDPFVRIERTVIEDPNLSAAAKVVLAWLLDKTTFPGGWETDVGNIAQIMREGIYSIRTALEDLEAVGYLKRVEATKVGGRGKKAEWWVTDDPAKPWIESEVYEATPTANRAQKRGSASSIPLLPHTDQTKEGAATPLRARKEVAAKQTNYVDARAVLIADEVWKRADPKPANGYPYVRSVARKLAAVRADDAAIVEAMLSAPTVTVAAVEIVLNGRGAKRNGSRNATAEDWAATERETMAREATTTKGEP